MDKTSNTGKAGQLPWAKPGIGNDAYNKLIANMRKYGRMFSQKQSQTYRVQHS